MAYVVRMPQLGMNMESGSVVEWGVAEGEQTTEGETLVVVESEKTTNDVETREDGLLLETFVELEEEVPPGYPIGFVGQEGDEVPDDVREELEGGESAEAESAAEESTDEIEESDDSGPKQAVTQVDQSGGATPQVGAATQQLGKADKISPRARSYADENNISLEGISGSGPEGAVVEQDVIEAEQAGTVATTASTGTVQAGGRQIVEERPLTGMRSAIASRMTQSAQQAPQVTLNRRVPVDAVLDIKERLAEDRDVDLSLTDFVIAAVVDAVEEYPEFNAIYEDDTLKLADNVNIGMAVDIENGLITPVLEAADKRTLEGINAERSRLVERALEGTYTNDDLSDGTFTITNLGHFDIESFDPILNPPEVAILGVNNIQKEQDPETGEVQQLLSLSLTFDHRAVDGADAAKFLDAIADAFAHPLRLVSLGGAETSTGPFRETDAPLTDGRTAQASSDGGMTANVRSRRFEWVADEPEAVGGTDSAPNPVEQFLGSLSSCLTLMIGNMADRRNVPVDGIEVTVDAAPDEGRIQRLDIDVEIDSSAEIETLEELVAVSENACFVNQVVSEDVDRSVSVSRR